MKYYLPCLWASANSIDQQEREQSDKEWDQLTSLYAKYFSTIQNRLPKKFIQLYYKYHGFHDAAFHSIGIGYSKNNKLCIQLSIVLDKIIHTISYYDVIKYSLKRKLDMWKNGMGL